MNSQKSSSWHRKKYAKGRGWKGNPMKHVQISRGHCGYGFTISSQNPCILSCIIRHSPAELAGLKAGDSLQLVNGMDVSRASHDDVVRIIGQSTGLLDLYVINKLCVESSEDQGVQEGKRRHSDDILEAKRNSDLVWTSQSRARHQERKRKARSRPLPGIPLDQNLSYTFLKPLLSENSNSSQMHSEHEQKMAKRTKQCTDSNPKPVRNVASGCVNTNNSTAIHEQFMKKSESEYQQWTKRCSDLNLRTARDADLQSVHLARSTTLPEKNVRKAKSECRQKAMQQKRGCRDLGSNQVKNMTISGSGNLNTSAMIPEDCHKQEDRKRVSFAKTGIKAVVGYIGSIRLTPDDASSSYLQQLQSSVDQLQEMQKYHTLVLMEVGVSGLKLTSGAGGTVAHYSVNQLIFAGVCPKHKHFFGVITLHPNSIMNGQGGHHSAYKSGQHSSSSTSCHVFMIDPDLICHDQHVHKAKAFNLYCIPHLETQNCDEFPLVPDHLVSCINDLYQSRSYRDGNVVQSYIFGVSSRQHHNSSDSSLGDQSKPRRSNRNSGISDPFMCRHRSSNSSSDSGLDLGQEEVYDNQECVDPYDGNVCLLDLEEQADTAVENCAAVQKNCTAIEKSCSGHDSDTSKSFRESPQRWMPLHTSTTTKLLHDVSGTPDCPEDTSAASENLQDTSAATTFLLNTSFIAGRLHDTSASCCLWNVSLSDGSLNQTAFCTCKSCLSPTCKHEHPPSAVIECPQTNKTSITKSLHSTLVSSGGHSDTPASAECLTKMSATGRCLLHASDTTEYQRHTAAISGSQSETLVTKKHQREASDTIEGLYHRSGTSGCQNQKAAISGSQVSPATPTECPYNPSATSEFLHDAPVTSECQDGTPPTAECQHLTSVSIGSQHDGPYSTGCPPRHAATSASACMVSSPREIHSSRTPAPTRCSPGHASACGYQISSPGEHHRSGIPAYTRCLNDQPSTSPSRINSPGVMQRPRKPARKRRLPHYVSTCPSAYHTSSARGTQKTKTPASTRYPFESASTSDYQISSQRENHKTRASACTRCSPDHASVSAYQISSPTESHIAPRSDCEGQSCFNNSFREMHGPRSDGDGRSDQENSSCGREMWRDLDHIDKDTQTTGTVDTLSEIFVAPWMMTNNRNNSFDIEGVLKDYSHVENDTETVRNNVCKTRTVTDSHMATCSLNSCYCSSDKACSGHSGVSDIRDNTQTTRTDDAVTKRAVASPCRACLSRSSCPGGSQMEQKSLPQNQEQHARQLSHQIATQTVRTSAITHMTTDDLRQTSPETEHKSCTQNQNQNTQIFDKQTTTKTVRTVTEPRMTTLTSSRTTISDGKRQKSFPQNQEQQHTQDFDWQTNTQKSWSVNPQQTTWVQQEQDTDRDSTDTVFRNSDHSVLWTVGQQEQDFSKGETAMVYNDSDHDVASSAGQPSCVHSSLTSQQNAACLHDQSSTGHETTRQRVTDDKRVVASSEHSQVTSHQTKNSRVTGWAVSFPHLLSDSFGRHIFTEFLKTEHSEENIMFWNDVEAFRHLPDPQSRRMKAYEIYNTYLSIEASNPVNVDSTARQASEQYLHDPSSLGVFDVPQKQIYDLMRTDCYRRFLKSDLYKGHLMRQTEDQGLTLSDISADKPVLQENMDKGAGKEREKKRRRSFLLWKHNTKSASKEIAKKRKKGTKTGKENNMKNLDLDYCESESKWKIADNEFQTKTADMSVSEVMSAQESPTVLASGCGSTLCNVLDKFNVRRRYSSSSDAGVPCGSKKMKNVYRKHVDINSDASSSSSSSMSSDPKQVMMKQWLRL